MLSRTPLSDLIFDKRQTKYATIVSEAGISMHDQFEKDATCNSMKMTLKVMFQKSTNKLFAQADEDFVDFLFSLLVIPLGRVEWLLGSNTGLKNIDNLHRSIVDHIDDKYLMLPKQHIIKPMVYDLYSFRHFLPFSEVSQNSHQAVDRPFFVGGSRMYMVTDDLTVTRLCMYSSLSILNEMKISLSDVEEVELQVGLEEALSILKASLTSTRALTNGLINPKLK